MLLADGVAELSFFIVVGGIKKMHASSQVVDQEGYRLNIGIVLCNAPGCVFLGRRIGQDAWQFPQGGMQPDESPEEALYRELLEETGLEPGDVEILGRTQDWLQYRLPEQYIRYYSKPLVIGQKQLWFLLRLTSSQQKLRLDASASPEFDSWRWVPFWYPLQDVVYFKRQVYRDMLQELEPLLFSNTTTTDDPGAHRSD